VIRVVEPLLEIAPTEFSQHVLIIVRVVSSWSLSAKKDSFRFINSAGASSTKSINVSVNDCAKNQT
jgi:hypothetical protein